MSAILKLISAARERAGQLSREVPFSDDMGAVLIAAEAKTWSSMATAAEAERLALVSARQHADSVTG